MLKADEKLIMDFLENTPKTMYELSLEIPISRGQLMKIKDRKIPLENITLRTASILTKYAQEQLKKGEKE